ncbi:hypothetical protein [Latilactobacillus sakei]|uniref:hypothetical protein n=1 Tax=Latilactobacillus sakei TaxID=1599 RepID=UPI0030A0B286
MTLADKIELINDAHKRAKQSHNYNAVAYYEAQLDLLESLFKQGIEFIEAK